MPLARLRPGLLSCGSGGADALITEKQVEAGDASSVLASQRVHSNGFSLCAAILDARGSRPPGTFNGSDEPGDRGPCSSQPSSTALCADP